MQMVRQMYMLRLVKKIYPKYFGSLNIGSSHEKKKKVSSQVTVAPQTLIHLLKSDGPNNLYGGIKPSEMDIYNRYPYSSKLSHNFPTLL